MKNTLTKLVHRVVYRNDPELLHNPFIRSQNYFILQGVFGTIFTLLTGGVFISGFAVYLGASDEVVSYIALIPSICGIFLVFCGIFLENVHSKKKAAILLIILSKLLICSIVSIPLFVPEEARQKVLLAVMVVAYTLQALNSVIINKWFISVVPGNIRGRYFAVRQSFALSVSVVLPLITGWFMDTVGNKYTGFIVLYTLGMVAMAVEAISLLRIDEPAVESLERSKVKVIDIIRLPVKNREFLKYVITLFIFHIILYFSASFSAAYMIRYLKLPYTLINLISILSAILQIFMLRVWGRLGDKYGHQFVMYTSIWFFAGEALIWAIASRFSIIPLIPVICVFSAAANSGFATGAFNRRYMIIPEKGRSIYDGFYIAAVGIALLITPVMAGRVKALLASNDFIRETVEFGEFRGLYMITCIGIIVLQLVNMGINKKSLTPTHLL